MTPLSLADDHGTGLSAHSAPPTSLYPLDVCCQLSGAPVPAWSEITSHQLPPPLLPVLLHEESMTKVLERAFGGPLQLRVIRAFSQRDDYFRRIILYDGRRHQPVQLAAVGLNLRAFTPDVQRQIVAAEAPLGRLLDTAGVPYLSMLRALLAVAPTDEMVELLQLRSCDVIYGRQTRISVGGVIIGSIVEIVPSAG